MQIVKLKNMINKICVTIKSICSVHMEVNTMINQNSNHKNIKCYSKHNNIQNPDTETKAELLNSQRIQDTLETPLRNKNWE